MVFLHPEQCAAHQKADDFRAAVVKHQRAPLLVLALSRVCIFIARHAVKFCKAGLVAREVSRHPVHNHADARLVAAVDKAHKVLRRAVAGGRRKVARHLIAPGSVERVLRQRHQLNVRKAHFLHIRDQLVTELVVREHAAVRIFAPGARVHLVDVHRLVIMRVFFLVLKPAAVVPLVPRNVVVAGSRARTRLRVERIRVGLVRHRAVLRRNDELIRVKFL